MNQNPSFNEEDRTVGLFPGGAPQGQPQQVPPQQYVPQGQPQQVPPQQYVPQGQPQQVPPQQYVPQGQPQQVPPQQYVPQGQPQQVPPQQYTPQGQPQQVPPQQYVPQGQPQQVPPQRPKQESAEEIDQNIYTMGAQAYYTEAMSQLRSNRHVQVDESILQEIDKVSQKLSDKYGYESHEYRKFLQKLKDYENKADELRRLGRENKFRSVLMKILIGLVAVAVIVLVFFLFNTTSFFANQGQYNHIYKRNVMGTVEMFKEVPAKTVIKKGGRLYYINMNDNHIYSISAKDGGDEIRLGNDVVTNFVLIGDYICYINESDGGKLYEMTVDGTDRTKVYDGKCRSISNEGKTVEFIPENDPGNPQSYNPKSGELKKAVVE